MKISNESNTTGLTIEFPQDGIPKKCNGSLYWMDTFKQVVLYHSNSFFPDARIISGRGDCAGVLFSRNIGGEELVSQSLSIRDGAKIPRSELRKLQEAIETFHQVAMSKECSPGISDYLRGFELPDPKTMPDAWRVSSRDRSLIVLWGYDNRGGNSTFLPASSASKGWADAGRRLDVFALLQEYSTTFGVTRKQRRYILVLVVLALCIWLLGKSCSGSSDSAATGESVSPAAAAVDGRPMPEDLDDNLEESGRNALRLRALEDEAGELQAKRDKLGYDSDERDARIKEISEDESLPEETRRVYAGSLSGDDEDLEEAISENKRRRLSGDGTEDEEELSNLLEDRRLERELEKNRAEQEALRRREKALEDQRQELRRRKEAAQSERDEEIEKLEKECRDVRERNKRRRAERELEEDEDVSSFEKKYKRMIEDEEIPEETRSTYRRGEKSGLDDESFEDLEDELRRRKSSGKMTDSESEFEKEIEKRRHRDAVRSDADDEDDAEIRDMERRLAALRNSRKKDEAELESLKSLEELKHDDYASINDNDAFMRNIKRARANKEEILALQKKQLDLKDKAESTYQKRVEALAYDKVLDKAYEWLRDVSSISRETRSKYRGSVDSPSAESYLEAKKELEVRRVAGKLTDGERRFQRCLNKKLRVLDDANQVQLDVDSNIEVYECRIRDLVIKNRRLAERRREWLSSPAGSGSVEPADLKVCGTCQSETVAFGYGKNPVSVERCKGDSWMVTLEITWSPQCSELTGLATSYFTLDGNYRTFTFDSAKRTLTFKVADVELKRGVQLRSIIRGRHGSEVVQSLAEHKLTNRTQVDVDQIVVEEK